MTSDDMTASAGLCPRCAGTGRDPDTTSLQCWKCLGQGAVVIHSPTPPKVGSEELDAAWLAKVIQPTIRECLAHILVAGASDVQRAAAVEALERDEDARDILDGGSEMIAEAVARALAAPVDHPEVVGDEHHEFVADPYRPSQCVNCGRSPAARIHDAQPSDSPALEAGVAVKEAFLAGFDAGEAAGKFDDDTSKEAWGRYSLAEATVIPTDVEDALPTLPEAAKASRLLLRCNGYDLSTWTDDIWPDDDSQAAMRSIVGRAALAIPATEDQ